MQVLKDEVRRDILTVAEQEFLNRGFKNTSMRTIAKKSHTTLGNLYNYFESKESIFDAVVGDLPVQVDKLINEHQDKYSIVETIDIKGINQIIENTDPHIFGIHILLSKPFVIMMEGAKETKYEGYKEKFIELFKAHVLMHLGDKKQEKLAHMIAISFVEALLFIAKKQKNLDEGIKDFMNYCKIVIDGLISYLE